MKQVLASTFTLQGGLTKNEEKHLKKRIKKVYDEEVSESMREDFDGSIKITIDDNTSDFFDETLNDADFFGETIIGKDYESSLDYLNKKLHKLRKEKINRLI